MSHHSKTRFRSGVLSAAAVLCVTTAAAAQTFTPPTISTSSRTTPVSGYAQILAVDITDSGTVVFAQPQNGQLLSSKNGATPTVLYTLPTAGGGYPKGVAADHLGNGYLTDYAGHLWQVNLTSGAATDILSPCGSLFGYYLGTQTVAVDGSNNVYTAGNGSGSGTLPIVKITQAGACSTVATGDANSYVAADGLGNVYYSLGSSNIYMVAAGTTTSTLIASGLTINGLHADSVGNLYVTNASTIDEYPNLNGAPSAASKFVILPYSSASSIGSNSLGTLVTSDGSSLSISTPGSMSFGSYAKGSTSTASTADLYFNSAATISSFKYTAGATASSEIASTGAGTCAAGSYSAGTSCTLTLTMTPGAVGSRQGAVQILSGTAVLGTLSVSSQGTGAALTVDPGTQTTLGSGYTAPSGIALDASGNIAMVDASANTATFFTSGSSTGTTVVTGLNAPSAVAFAADGSLYLANTGAGTVVYVPRSTSGSFGTASTVVSGLTSPAGLTVASDGSLYVSNKTQILHFPNNGGVVDFSTREILSNSLTSAAGLTTDASGNLIAVDTAAGSILKFTGVTSSTLLSGLSSPLSTAISPSGSLFIALAETSAIQRVPYSAGSYNLNAATLLGSGLSSPVSVAMDGAGNLLLADKQLPGVVELQRTAGSLNLGKFNVGSASATQSFSIINHGTAAITFGSPLYSTSGNTDDFTLSSSGTSACSAGGTLSTGSACTVSATFSPTTTGSRSETLTFASNAVNATSITGTLTGTGINLPKTTTTLSQTTTGSITFGQTVQVSASIALESGTGTPTGTVQFYLNGSSFGSAVTLSNNTATQTLTGLPAGSNTVSAVYSGDDNFAGSTASSLTISVAQVVTSTTLTSTASASTPVLPSTSVTLTAAVSSTLATASPSGSVTFSGNGQVIATIALSGGTASYTGQLPTGTYSVLATYSGDTGFASSISNTVSVSIRAADFDLSSTPTALTVHAPGSVTTSFTVTPISTYTGGIDMACSGLPANTQCTFVPAVINFQNSNGVAPSAKTIQLVLSTNTAPASTVAWLLPLGGLGVLGLVRRRKLPRTLTLAFSALAVLGVAGLSGCGNSNSAITPTGTQTVTVTLTGTPTGTSTPPTSGTGNIIKTFTFQLTVN